MRYLNTFRRADCATVYDLPFDDKPGTVRGVAADGRLYICLGTNANPLKQWQPWDADAQAFITREATNALGSITGTKAIDWNVGDKVSATITGNTTFSFVNNHDGDRLTVAVTNTGAFTVTWPVAVKWPAGTAPTQTTGAHTDVYSFVTIGSTIYGSVVANY